MRYLVFYLALFFTSGVLAENVPLPKKFTVKTEKGDIIISDVDVVNVSNLYQGLEGNKSIKKMESVKN